MNESAPHIIVTGNPVEGFEFFGPFGSWRDAVDAAETHRFEGDWWIAELQSLEA